MQPVCTYLVKYQFLFGTWPLYIFSLHRVQIAVMETLFHDSASAFHPGKKKLLEKVFRKPIHRKNASNYTSELKLLYF